MADKQNELAGINIAVDEQERIVKELEDKLFLEQLRLAALNAARETALRRAMFPGHREAGN